MSPAGEEHLTQILRPPEPGFALTYLQALPPPESVSDRRSFKVLLRAALFGVAIQLALTAILGVVAIVFIEDLHSE